MVTFCSDNLKVCVLASIGAEFISGDAVGADIPDESGS